MAINETCWTNYVPNKTTQHDYLLQTLELLWEANERIVELEPTPTIIQAVNYLHKALDLLEEEE